MTAPTPSSTPTATERADSARWQAFTGLAAGTVALTVLRQALLSYADMATLAGTALVIILASLVGLFGASLLMRRMPVARRVVVWLGMGVVSVGMVYLYTLGDPTRLWGLSAVLAGWVLAIGPLRPSSGQTSGPASAWEQWPTLLTVMGVTWASAAFVSLPTARADLSQWSGMLSSAAMMGAAFGLAWANGARQVRLLGQPHARWSPDYESSWRAHAFVFLILGWLTLMLVFHTVALFNGLDEPLGMSIQTLGFAMALPLATYMWRQGRLTPALQTVVASLAAVAALLLAVNSQAPHQVLDFQAPLAALLVAPKRARWPLLGWVLLGAAVTASQLATPFAFMYAGAVSLNGLALMRLCQLDDHLSTQLQRQRPSLPDADQPAPGHQQAQRMGLAAGSAVAVLGLVLITWLQPLTVNGVLTLFHVLAGVIVSLAAGALVYGLMRWREAQSLKTQLVANAQQLALTADIERALADLERDNLALQEAQAKAHHAAQFKGQFLANMSHEIRTPINGVRGYLSLLARRSLGTQADVLLRKAEESAHTLTETLNQVLDLAKLESGQFSLDPQVCNLRDLCTHLQTDAQPAAQLKGLTLRTVVGLPVPDFVRTDADRLSQVMRLMLAHAVRVSESGSLGLTLMSAPTDHGHVLRVEVSDQGPVLSAQAVGQLLTPFDSTVAGHWTGELDLGMALAHQLLLRMGSTGLRLDPPPHHGNALVFELPVQAADDDAVRDHLAQQQSLEQVARVHHLQGVRVLLVDDSLINIEVGANLLQNLGATVSFALNGKKALEVLERMGDSAFDIVLMDLQMPVMDGLQATQAIQAHPQWRHLPVVAMTANHSLEDKKACLAVGMKDLIPKPVDAANLLTVVARHHRRHPSP